MHERMLRIMAPRMQTPDVSARPPGDDRRVGDVSYVCGRASGAGVGVHVGWGWVWVGWGK